VIDGSGLEAQGEIDGAGGAEAVGVEFAGEAECARGFEEGFVKWQEIGIGVDGEIGEAGGFAAMNFGKEVVDNIVGGGGGVVLGKAAEEAGNNVEGFAAEGGEDAEELGFGAFVCAAAGFGFDGGGAVAGHGLDGGTDPGFNAAAGGGADAAGGVVVGFAGSGGKGEVGVGIDEAGHDDTAGGVDLPGVAGAGEVFEAAGGTDFGDEAIADEDRTVDDGMDFVEGGSRTGLFRSAQGKKLAGATN